jgi:hypothetical protein
VWGIAVGASALSLLWREQLTGLNALVAILVTLGVALGLIVWVVRR